MSCSINKFVITKGSDNVFSFVIKETGSTLPIVIELTDTFNARLVLLSDDSVAITKALDVVDLANGKVSLTITTAEADGLVTGKGPQVDRYYLKPMYKLIIDCVTVVNGTFIAKVDEVYVD